ncbi:polycomb protein [Gracilaria domingensis]|nr:polycomb protein [Gracilaria domingensis]
MFQAPTYEQGEYVPLMASIRLCLCVRQDGGHYVSFSLRDLSVRVWPAEDLAAGLVDPCDVAVRETFDISAVLPVLSSDAEALSLVVELAPVLNGASDASRTRDKLRGELVLWEKGSANGTVVPNGFVTLPLYLVNDNAIQPKHVVLERSIRQSSTSFASGTGDIPFVGAGAASVVLQLEGAPQNSISKAVRRHKPKLMITLTYTSQQVPHWNGITRHDFVCPWCHRNCYRYRTLLGHFQMEHEHMKFQLTSLKSGKPSDTDDVNSATVSRNETVPFLVRFSVERMDSASVRTDSLLPSSVPKRMRSCGGTVQLPEQVIYANPQRYGSYVANANNNTGADEQFREAMERVSLRDNALSSDVQSLASTELYDNARRDLLSTVQEELRTCCKHCQRPHDFAYKGNTNFCSEWCEAIYTVNRDEDGLSLRGNRRYFPLSSYSSYNARKRFDFRSRLGHRKLFHVVSMTPVKEEHYDEDDPDSEDEVDQSWRGRLAIERAMYLEKTTTTETLFMVMWNKFAHDNFPLPSLYGDRFTRYTLELFAIENRAHIIRLRLRLKFLAFLRVLHMHGLIDSVAVLSIFQCLDGKKKRRDIALSSRPERSVPGSNGKGGRSRRVGARI